MTHKNRRSFTPDQKTAAVVRHLQDGVAVSALCDELEIHPNQYYDWQKQALGNLSAAFRKSDAVNKHLEAELAAVLCGFFGVDLLWPHGGPPWFAAAA